MAQHSRLHVLNAIHEAGLVLVFYHPDLEVAKQIVGAAIDGGLYLIEFTNRGDFAPSVFAELVRYAAGKDRRAILGAGTVTDAPTAALYIASGANFIVGPNLNPEVARLCNRRKVAYMPGCATPSEIGQAEELGCEVVKVFPAQSVGGPAFIKDVLGPSPWSRIMVTGGVETNRESIDAWFKAGVTAVGIGSQLTRKEWIESGNYAAMSAVAAEVLGYIREARGGSR